MANATDHEVLTEVAAELPLMLSRARVADTLGVCERTVDRMIARGELQRVYVAGSVRIPRSSLAALLRSAIEAG
jgi:excisionase family DNA binding protein